ncbi:MAG TPA: serine kinase/phosphatase [Pseudomonas xinjiangensis]|uniref:Serine kinase/phosphatase n=2 Tax=root TaxID=1 RepID=A0A7V1BKR3_9GAMM|nr:serine kinase/phosphatase [Halopseudomonas xinjiangensis]HEC48301.1 serine kinase/phosphatase [Halopseudomonas xinjiangensis]
MTRSPEDRPVRNTTDALEPEQEVRELDFEEDGPMGPVGGLPADEELVERAGEAGLTEASMPGEGPTADDASPETLIREDGARSPDEAGGGLPADKELTAVEGDEVGVQAGLDEAELARTDPLDGKPWDGEPER